MEYFRFLSKVERKLTLFSVLDKLLRFIRTVSRKGLVVKIILSLSVSISIRWVMGTRV